jgi:hypothetical protein
MESAVLLLGSYGLLLYLLRRTAPAALFAVALWASPFFHWWYLDPSLASARLVVAALAAFLAAMQQTSRTARLLPLALSAWSLIGFALVVYPPFQVPVAIAMVFIGLGDLYGRYESVRYMARSVLPSLAAVAIASGVLFGIYYLQHRTAIRLIAKT